VFNLALLRKRYMKKLSLRLMAVVGTLAIIAFVPGATKADDKAVVPCPNPLPAVSITRGGTQAATPSTTDFPSTPAGNLPSAYGQTGHNRAFYDTIVFRKPSTRECCQLGQIPGTPYYGKLTVTYKSLQAGSGPNASDSGNDAGGLVYHGAGVSGQTGAIYAPTFVFAVGHIVTRTYFLNAAEAASGQVSFSVEDDTAVVSAALAVPGGCCVLQTRT
jgi:hypothetical protein